MSIRRLWAGMLTKNTTNAGTDNSIVLTINEDGVDRLQKTFADTPQDDQEQGQANIYEVDVAANNITPANLNASSIHVGIRGDNQWDPEHFIVWGQSDNAVIPMAIETNLSVGISNDPAEANGKISFPVRRVNSGDEEMQINRLLMLTTTRNVTEAGTDSSINLRITRSNSRSILVDFDIPDTPQLDQEKGQANFYFVPVNESFTKEEISSIRLSIESDDVWKPRSFFLFGLDDGSGRPETLVPLVHVPNWDSQIKLSTDPNKGVPSHELPLV